MSLLKTPDSSASTWPPTYVSESRTWPSLVSLLKTYKNVWYILLVQTGRTTIYIGKGRVSLVWSMPEYCYSPLDRMLVHHRVTPSSMLPVPIYTAGWRETMWSKVPCLRKRKQRNSEAWTPDLQIPLFEVLTTRPHMPPQKVCTYCRQNLFLG